MKIVCWDCWECSTVKSESPNRLKCKKCGSKNVTPYERDVFLEYGPEDAIKVFGARSKWSVEKIIDGDENVIAYKAFWANPILKATYDEPLFYFKYPRSDPDKYRYGVVFSDGNAYFKCETASKNNHLQVPTIIEISKDEYESFKNQKGDSQ